MAFAFIEAWLLLATCRGYLTGCLPVLRMLASQKALVNTRDLPLIRPSFYSSLYLAPRLHY